MNHGTTHGVCAFSVLSYELSYVRSVMKRRDNSCQRVSHWRERQTDDQQRQYDAQQTRQRRTDATEQA